jgi:outer membrane protein TolC
LVLGAAVTGCAHYKAAPLAPEQTAAALDRRSFDAPGLRDFIQKNLHRDAATWPPSEWDFELLTMAAIYYHPDMELARAEWGVVRAGIETAGARPNPSVTLAPGLNFNHINAAPGLSPWIPVASFDVPIETAGKRGKRIAQAERLSESARLNIAATAWQVRAKVRGGMLDLTAAQQRQALLQEQISMQEQMVSLMDQQVQAGGAAASEVVAFRIALQKSRLDLADAERQQAEARASLAEAVGMPLSAFAGIRLQSNLPETAPAELTTAEVRQHALTGRADILAALSDYAAAEAALQLEIARQYPDVHFGPSYQFDQGDNKWNLGLTVELPVLDHNKGPIAEAMARRTAAAARFNALQAKVLAEIDSAVESYRATETNLTMIAALAASQARARDAIAGQVTAGAAAPLDLLSAKLEYAAADMGRLEARLKRQQSLAAIEDAVQRPIELITPAVIEPSPTAVQEKKP